MKLLSRREAGKLLVAGSAGLMAASRSLCAAEKINSVVRGVRIGAQSYSFRDRPLDACIDAFRTTGLGICELWQGHVEPRNMKRPDAAKWHLTAPLSEFREIREKFERAGIELLAYSFGFRLGMTAEAVERAFKEAQAMRVRYLTSSANLSLVPLVDEYAQKYKITVAFHGHAATDKPDEFSTAETFERGLKGGSKYLAINLDIGHFVAAGGDPIDFLVKHHQKIPVVHLKDRKKDGANLPFGEGDTPIVEVLQMIRDNMWDTAANIEYEYGGKEGKYDTIAEIKKCFAYCRKALES